MIIQKIAVMIVITNSNKVPMHFWTQVELKWPKMYKTLIIVEINAVAKMKLILSSLPMVKSSMILPSTTSDVMK